jgi:hypothetical protein
LFNFVSISEVQENQVEPRLIGIHHLWVYADDGEEINIFWILVGNPEGTGPLSMRDEVFACKNDISARFGSYRDRMEWTDLAEVRD